jgi:hypothetical protein
VWGPLFVTSQSSLRYYLLFTDQFSRFNWIYCIAHKSDVSSVFAQFKALVENLLSATIKTVQIDGGTEFKPMMRAHPTIQFHIFCPYTPKQNGLVECKHRQIVELGLATMFHSSIPLQYWPDVFESATFVLNSLPSSSISISFSTLYTVLFQRKPDYSFFKVIGCKCYPYIRPYADHKLASRSTICVFLGYSLLHKGYKCLDITTNKIYFSRHVIFHETSFPFKESFPSCSTLPASSIPTSSPLVILQSPPNPPSLPSFISSCTFFNSSLTLS